MLTDEKLVELLMRRDELQEQGCDASPEEVCKDCPELLEERSYRSSPNHCDMPPRRTPERLLRHIVSYSGDTNTKKGPYTESKKFGQIR